MGFQEDVKTDLRLRNLTIHAQWLSITAAALLYLIGIPLLVVYLVQLSPLLSSKWYAFESVIHAILFPLAPLALDLPHYIPRIPVLYLSMASSIEFTVLAIFMNVAHPSFEHSFRNFSKVAILMLTTFIVSSGIWMTHVTKGHFGTRIRFCVNILCCTHLVIAWFEPVKYGIGQHARIFYFVIAGLFGTAALLCGIAWTRRHQWVYSLTLGGTAIEPMVLTVPGRGPRYQSVGDEAREGAIRLV